MFQNEVMFHSKGAMINSRPAYHAINCGTVQLDLGRFTPIKPGTDAGKIPRQVMPISA